MAKRLNAFCVFIFTAFLQFFTPYAYAQESDTELLKTIRDTLNDLGALVNNTIEQGMTLITDMAFTPDPNVANTMLINLNYKQRAVLSASSETNNRLTDTMSLYLDPIELHQDTTPRAYSLMPSTNSQVSVQVPNFLIGSILNKTGIVPDTKEANYAQNFINVLIDLDNTPKNLKFIAFSSLTNPQANYLTALGSFIAAQSVALNNLYDMFAKRMVIKGLGTNVGMVRLYQMDVNDGGTVGTPIADASPMQVDEYMANRRIMNPKWYADMEAAPHATVSRETLYVLAEIRQEMFQQRMMMEKMTANIAAFQLQQAQQENRAKYLIKPAT